MEEDEVADGSMRVEWHEDCVHVLLDGAGNCGRLVVDVPMAPELALGLARALERAALAAYEGRTGVAMVPSAVLVRRADEKPGRVH